MGLRESLIKSKLFKEYKRNKEKKKFKGSENYWEERYQQEGNSGTGSYDHLAEDKANVINEFVKANDLKSILEFGCGDGNQLTLAKYPKYIGLDVSPTAIKKCYNLFKTDQSKSFYVYNSTAFVDNAGLFKAELTMSLDVLYHLVEQEIFESHIKHLFEASTKYVLIYASDYKQSEEPLNQHENRRTFTDYVAKNIKGWKLKNIVKTKYPYSEFKEKGTLSDYYFYEKTS